MPMLAQRFGRGRLGWCSTVSTTPAKDGNPVTATPTSGSAVTLPGNGGHRHHDKRGDCSPQPEPSGRCGHSCRSPSRPPRPRPDLGHSAARPGPRTCRGCEPVRERRHSASDLTSRRVRLAAQSKQFGLLLGSSRVVPRGHFRSLAASSATPPRRLSEVIFSGGVARFRRRAPNDTRPQAHARSTAPVIRAAAQTGSTVAIAAMTAAIERARRTRQLRRRRSAWRRRASPVSWRRTARPWPARFRSAPTGPSDRSAEPPVREPSGPPSNAAPA